jgi:hypothetical protein
MSVEALWSVEFFSNQEIFGSGVAVLETQRVLGGDSQYTYVGEYDVQNNSFNARITVRHYSGEPFSVFGNREEFNLILSGAPEQQTFEVNGYIEGEPQNEINIRLTRRAELPNP